MKRPKINPAMIQAASDMNAHIEGVPQSAQANLVGAPLPPDPNMQQQNQQHGMPGQVQGSQPYVNPNMTVESVGSLVQGEMAGVKSMLPELELLTEEEKTAAGQILLPAMQGIQDKRIQKYVLLILGLFGIVGPKIGKTLNARKERKVKEAKQKKEEKEQEERVEETKKVGLYTNKKAFNPDELKISKQDVIDQFDAMEKRWSKNKKSNWKLILAIQGMKAWVHMTSDAIISAIWSEILAGFNDLLMQNSIAVAKGNNERWATTFEKIKKARKEEVQNE